MTLASRHLFPVVSIKWRPLDDFLIVGCSDGTVYVWQMETGHLDRVLHGMLAEEVMSACDENVAETSGGSTSEMGLSNPAVHFFRGLRHRNLSAIRHATQRGIHQLQQLHSNQNQGGDFLMKNRSSPLLIQGLRTNPKDAESHILFFDIEGLIFELHSEEYASMSAEALEVRRNISVRFECNLLIWFGIYRLKDWSRQRRFWPRIQRLERRFQVSVRLSREL